VQEFVLKTIVNGIGPVPDKYTAYLFSTNGNVVIPIKLDLLAVENLLITQQNLPQVRPTVYDTFERSLKISGSKLCCLYIYLMLDGIFYTYLRIFQNGKTVDVDIKLSDGLCMAIKAKVPIMVDDSIAAKFSLQSASLHKYF
jgi:bifunctional DNase/RNase